MLQFLVHLLASAVLLAVVAWIVPGVQVRGALSAVLGALVLGLANAIVRPVLVILTIPVTILTFGLFLLVINALMFMLAAAVVPGFRVGGCGAALLGSIVLTLLNLVVGIAFGVSLALF